MNTEVHGGWVVEFHKNVHKYWHSLRLSRAGEAYDVPCENSTSGHIIIWPYQLKIADAVYKDLFLALREWADQSGFHYRLYTSPKDYEADSPYT